MSNVECPPLPRHQSSRLGRGRGTLSDGGAGEVSSMAFSSLWIGVDVSASSTRFWNSNEELKLNENPLATIAQWHTLGLPSTSFDRSAVGGSWEGRPRRETVWKPNLFMSLSTTSTRTVSFPWVLTRVTEIRSTKGLSFGDPNGRCTNRDGLPASPLTRGRWIRDVVHWEVLWSSGSWTMPEAQSRGRRGCDWKDADALVPKRWTFWRTIYGV